MKNTSFEQENSGNNLIDLEALDQSRTHRKIHPKKKFAQ
jgi:hypothetical protein